MPIRPKGGIGAAEILMSLGGERAFRANLAGREHRAGLAVDERRGRWGDNADAREALAAQRAQERHELEIERAKRQEAEEEAKFFREDQEREAQKDAGKIAMERLRSGAASEGPGDGGLDPEERSILSRAESIADRMGAAAREKFLNGEVAPFLQSRRLARAKNQTADRAADTIKNIATADFDTSPLVAEIQGGVELLNSAETPEQVIAATKAITSATVTATKTVHEESVKEDVKQHGMAAVQEIFAGDPAKAKQQSWIVRAIQFGIIAADKGIEMAVTDKYGLKPPSAADIAAKGGPMAALYTMPQGKQANAHMATVAKDRTWKDVAAELGPKATREERRAAFDEQFPKNLAIVHAENGWFAAEPTQGTQLIDPNRDAHMRPEWRRPAPGSVQGRGAAPAAGAPKAPRVPLEAVREAMGAAQGPAAAGAAPASVPQEDPMAAARAIGLQIKAQGEAEGWPREKVEAAIKEALKAKGLIKG